MDLFLKEYTTFLKRFEPLFRRELESYRHRIASIARGAFFSYFLDQALAPSKRLRPFLIYAGYRCGGGKNIERALKLGAAMEALHTMFLIQDDVIDQSSTRRGKPTIHEVVRQRYGKNRESYHYGVSTVFLEADLGFSFASQLVHGLKNREVETEFYHLFLETVVGEQMDIDLAFQRRYGKRRLLEDVLTLKSGRYSIDRPLTLGLALAGKARWIPQFLAFSNPVGRVFQVVDDYLGTFGNEREVGKPTDSDLKEGKATLVIYYGLKKATPSERKKIFGVLGNRRAKTRDIREVKTILKPYVDQPIEKYIEQNAALSLSRLERLPISEQNKQLFRGFIEYVKNRTQERS